MQEAGDNPFAKRRADELAKFYALQERFGAQQEGAQAGDDPNQQFYHKLHKEIYNVEYMVTLSPRRDLAAGTRLSGTPEDRARQFLLDHWTLFSFFDPLRDSNYRQFAARLFLKHSMRSRMGTHCIFGWRISGSRTDRPFAGLSRLLGARSGAAHSQRCAPHTRGRG